MPLLDIADFSNAIFCIHDDCHMRQNKLLSKEFEVFIVIA